MRAPKSPMTPVERVGNYFVKREDLFEIAGVRGAKARTAWSLCQGATGLITAGSRSSPQIEIIGNIAKTLGVPFQAHTPMGNLSGGIQKLKDEGAEIIQHKAGYNNVIIARARQAAENLGWTNIPFGMECGEAIVQTEEQVFNIPQDVNRIIVPVGSGMNFAGILHGLVRFNRNIPVVGVRVGADPTKRLNRWVSFWQDRAILVDAGVPYDQHVDASIGDIRLDPIYEAKCLKFVTEPNDLLWIVGIRN